MPPLEAHQLRKPCRIDLFKFETTKDLDSDLRIIGQPRGTSAIKFGLNIDSPGYNIYVLGESGTGRTTAIQTFVEDQAKDERVPPDWIYVHNFREPHRPFAYSLPAGVGCMFREEMDRLIENLQIEITRAFESQTYRDEALEIKHNLDAEREALFADLQAKAKERGAFLSGSSEGFQLLPIVEGQPINPNQISQLTQEQQDAWTETAHELEHEMHQTFHRARKLEHVANDEIQTLSRETAQAVVEVSLEDPRERFAEYPVITAHLDKVQEDLIGNHHLFQDGEIEEEESSKKHAREVHLRRYRVNVIVDRTGSEHAPVVVEYNPTVPGLLGRVEHEMRFGGAVVTDFTLLRCGALHSANGGYLVLRARDLFAEPGAWEALKRALVRATVRPDDPATRRGATTRSLDPQEIPLDLKVLIIGPPQVYYTLHASDEDFRSTFKVMADFDLEMDRTSENEHEYAAFIANLCDDEGMRHFSRAAVGRVVEYGSRIAGSQEKLSTRFGHLADLVREANYWSLSRTEKGDDQVVELDDVRRAIQERVFFRNRIESKSREQVQKGKRMIATQGKIVGQINGLSVSQVGEHTFGQPNRVTARTYVGREGVVQIDREVKLAGPIHNKGTMTLVGYLGGQYAEEHQLSLSAQITFEQNYGGIEGDSASSTELYALLSSLSGITILQSLAVTGSVNQRGEIQAIGGATEKIEGWFDVCQERGLSGEQGVLIPEANTTDLMLRDDVVEAVGEGLFHIWTVSTVDEGMEVLTGRSSEEIHSAVISRLQLLAEKVQDKSGSGNNL